MAAQAHGIPQWSRYPTIGAPDVPRSSPVSMIRRAESIRGTAATFFVPG